MITIRATRVPASLVDGKVKRVVELDDGTLKVQVWRWRQWNDADSAAEFIVAVQNGLDVPPHVLRILGVPPSDWRADEVIPRPGTPRVWLGFGPLGYLMELYWVTQVVVPAGL